PGGLSDRDSAIDRALAAVYDAGAAGGASGRGGGRPGSASQRASRGAGLGSSAPSVTRWLGDIRSYFPTPVVQVLQKDALDRLGLRRMLLEPELLEAVEPDIYLVG